MSHHSATHFIEPVWESEAMRRVHSVIQRVGPTDLPVLVTGESGTGKEVVVRALHAASNRATMPLVVVDCAAIAPGLMESELFGHQKGAFTGAASTTAGLAKRADNGTFFLDEIGELPPPVQVKLLRLLEDGSFRAVGGTTNQQSNLRLIAATNRTIEDEIAAGRFRTDLYHRLNAVHIRLIPLRQRRADIVPLMNRHLSVHCTALNRERLELSEAVCGALQSARWAGNVRELANCAQYVASLAVGPVVTLDDLPPAFLDTPIVHGSSMTPSVRTDLPYKSAKREWMDAFEEVYVREILRAANGNVTHAARNSGMDRRSIQRIMKRLRREQ